jgi:hypothetical protein
LAQEIA